MREILFRGKRKDNGEWIEGYLYQYQAKLLMSYEVIEVPSFSDPAGNWIYKEDEIVPETVGQFTGLLDKQGKKIFEGDIIKSGDDVMVVSWNNKFASFCLDKDGWAFSHWFGESCNPQNVEVIGNIHDTPK
jgi:uncharacterized phage protein (TIGR01671 family)